MTKFVSGAGKGTAIAAPAAPVAAPAATPEQVAENQPKRSRRGRTSPFVGLGIVYPDLDTAKANPPQFIEGYDGDREAAEKSIKIIAITDPKQNTTYTWGNSGVFILANIAKELGYTAESAERANTGKMRIPSETTAYLMLYKSLFKSGKIKKARELMKRDAPELEADFNRVLEEMQKAGIAPAE